MDLPTYILFERNLCIKDSFKISKKDFRQILEVIKEDHSYDVPGTLVFNRSMFSLSMEWAVHNALYNLGIAKSHTVDVDLDYPSNIEWLYIICGIIVYPFIK